MLARLCRLHFIISATWWQLTTALINPLLGKVITALKIYLKLNWHILIQKSIIVNKVSKQLVNIMYIKGLIQLIYTMQKA